MTHMLEYVVSQKYLTTQVIRQGCFHVQSKDVIFVQIFLEVSQFLHWHLKSAFLGNILKEKFLLSHL